MIGHSLAKVLHKDCEINLECLLLETIFAFLVRTLRTRVRIEPVGISRLLRCCFSYLKQIDSDYYFTVLLTKFEGVRQQVRQNLGEALLIAKESLQAF